MHTRNKEKAILGHYDTEVGLGNVYKFLADWPQALKAVLFGWEYALNHPAELHYALDFDGKHLNTALKRTTEEIFQELGLEKGTVLDAGCGLGGATFSLAKKYPHVLFIGVSLSSGQIDVARKRAIRAGIKNVRYYSANYLQLPLLSKSVDGVYAIETFCHVEDANKPRLMKELHRVLKAKGRVAIYDAYLTDRPKSRMVMAAQHAEIFRDWSLPEKISTAHLVTSVAQKQGFLVLTNTQMTNRMLNCSKWASSFVKLFRTFTFLIQAFIQMRKRGIRIPIIRHTGLDDPRIFAYAKTGELQYDMFRTGDVEYRGIVLEKV